MNDSIAYANLPSRVQAAVIDSIIIIALAYGVSELFVLFEDIPNYARIVAFIAIFLLYDPLFTSFNGATIGHSYSNIRVRKSVEAKNINFFNAVIRYVCKIFLGWLSLLTVTGDSQKRALHDLAVGSIVVQDSTTTKS